MENESINNFELYEEDLRIVLSDIHNLIGEIRGYYDERRKVAISAVERAFDEANEIVN